MEIFDTHLHLQDFETLPPEWGRDVTRAICVSAHLSDWAQVAALYQKFPQNLAPAFGLHPWYAEEASENFETLLEDKLRSFPQAMVGECGLDFLKGAHREVQESIFETHIRLAQAYHRPILIHAVKAWPLMAKYFPKLPEKFVIHSFNARPEQVRQILKYGGMIAVNASILKNKTATEILRLIPADKLLLESDAPYQTALDELPNLVQKIADIRMEKLEDLANQLYLNALELTHE